jgi:hypothetical protein
MPQTADSFRDREWEHFDVDQSCLYRFTEDEVRQHLEEADAFNENREFWDRHRGILTDEGYSSHETFNEATKVVDVLRRNNLAGGEQRNGLV